MTYSTNTESKNHIYVYMCVCVFIYIFWPDTECGMQLRSPHSNFSQKYSVYINHKHIFLFLGETGFRAIFFGSN